MTPEVIFLMLFLATLVFRINYLTKFKLTQYQLSSAFYYINKKEANCNSVRLLSTKIMVEAGGVEPPSERKTS